MALKTPSKFADLPAFIAEHITGSDLSRIHDIMETRVAPVVRDRLGIQKNNELLVIQECGHVFQAAAKILKASKDRNRRALGNRLSAWGGE